MKHEHLECGPHCCDWNIDEMEEALKGPFYTMPEGLSVEEMREWFKEFANNTDEENEKYLSKD